MFSRLAYARAASYDQGMSEGKTFAGFYGGRWGRLLEIVATGLFLSYGVGLVALFLAARIWEVGPSALPGEILIAVLVTIALPQVSGRYDVLRLRVFDKARPRWMEQLQHACGCALSAACTVLLILQTWKRAAAMLDGGHLVFGVVYYLLSCALAFAGIVLLLLIFVPRNQ